MWSPTGIPLLATEGMTYRMSDSETVALRKKKWRLPNVIDWI